MEKRHRQLLSLVILGAGLAMALLATVMVNLELRLVPAEFIRNDTPATIRPATYPEKNELPITFA